MNMNTHPLFNTPLLHVSVPVLHSGAVRRSDCAVPDGLHGVAVHHRPVPCHVPCGHCLQVSSRRLGGQRRIPRLSQHPQLHP